MGRTSGFQRDSNSRATLLTGILLLFLFSNIISSSISQNTLFRAEGKPASISSLQEKINGLNISPTDITKKLRDVKGEKIPNQYIVVLKNNNQLSTSSIKSLANEATNQGAAIRHIYENALDGFAIKVPNQIALEAILKIPDVAYVEPDIKMKAFAQSLPTGINRVDGDLSSTKSGDGSGSVNVDI
jgi:hypothetical protein